MVALRFFNSKPNLASSSGSNRRWGGSTASFFHADVFVVHFETAAADGAPSATVAVPTGRTGGAMMAATELALQSRLEHFD